MLLGIFSGLTAVSLAYATTSDPTPSPSVGHRPIVTSLKLTVDSHDITSPTTVLKPGDVITLLADGSNYVDVDGDTDKAGAHCVWYKVYYNGISSLVKKPPQNDRNCTYTVQTGDAGFKIKSVITLFSDQGIATQKGYTLNPRESSPTEIASARIVSGKFKSLSYNNKHTITEKYFDEKPAPTFANAKFILDTDENPTEYIWQSSNPSVMSVSSTGEVTMLREFSKPIFITATSKITGEILSYTATKAHNWIQTPRVKMNFYDAVDYCSNMGKKLMDNNLWTSTENSVYANWYPKGVPSETFGLKDTHWNLFNNKIFASSLDSPLPGFNAKPSEKHYVACIDI